jgi:Transposase DDE domain
MRFCPEGAERGNRRFVAVRPVEACAGEQPDVVAVDPRVHSIAVVFDFMEPVGAIRRIGSEPGELRLDPCRRMPFGRGAGLYRLARHCPVILRRAGRRFCSIERFQTIGYFEQLQRNVPARKIARSVHEAARDKARAIAKTEAYAISCRERKKVEMLFAHLKRILRLGRLRLRGPSGAKDEFLLAATAHNLRKLAKLIALPAPIFAT